MTICSKEARRILILNEMKGIGPGKLKKIMATVNFASMSIEQNLALIFSKPGDIEDRISNFNECESIVNRQLDLAQEHNVDILCSADDMYPELLRNSKFDCGILYIKGNIQKTKRSAAVIGTRELPTKWDQVAKRITETLIKKNFSIISGLAIGTDSVAHKTAVDHHGRTIAVLAHGLDSVFPKENQYLANRILDEGGALVSQFPIGTESIAYNFAKRDLIQEGLSEFVVMIASGIKGGSLIASRAALEDGRYLFVPKPFGDSAGHEKLEANRIAASGDESKISDLFLTKGSEPLSRLFVLESKNDYEKFDSLGGKLSEQYSLFD